MAWANVINATFYPVTIVFLLFLILGFILSIMKKNKSWNSGPALLAFGLLVIMVDVLKRLTAIRRPDGSDKRSFPSGHSAAAWFIVAYFALTKVGGQLYYKQIVFVWMIWATLVSASRVVLRRHSIIDVVVGGIIGIISIYSISYGLS